jgi:hypothetical protein
MTLQREEVKAHFTREGTVSQWWDPEGDRHAWSLYDYFEGTREADLSRYPAAHKIETWMREAGFVEVESGIAEQMRHSMSGQAPRSWPC